MDTDRLTSLLADFESKYQNGNLPDHATLVTFVREVVITFCPSRFVSAGNVLVVQPPPS
jgi:hypothetical protein